MSESYSYIGDHVYDGVHYHWCFPKENLERIKHGVNLHCEDIILASYPKSGSTWMQEITYLICNEADINERLAKSLDDIYPELELSIPDGVNSLDVVLKTPSPRFMKTHLQGHFFDRELAKGDKSAKFIIAMRNPRDILVSFYHFHKMAKIPQFQGSFNTFFDMFKEKRFMFGDPIDYLVSWDEYKDHPNMMFIRYEDMILDRETWIKKMAKFLGRDITDEMMEKIMQFTSFESMKKGGLLQVHPSWVHLADETASPFFRKGIINDYKNYFDVHHIDYVDKLCKEKLSSTFSSYK